MRKLIGAMVLALVFTPAEGSETPAPPVPALRGVTAVNVHVQPLCSFVDFDGAALVIDGLVRKALASAGIAVPSKRDPGVPTLAFLIHCEDISCHFGNPAIAEAASAIVPEGAGAPFIYVVSTRLSRTVSVPGQSEISEAVVWIKDGQLRLLGKRPFVALRDDILWSVDDFVADWEKARATATK